MPRNRNRVVRFSTNGPDISALVGAIVKRLDSAKQKAAVSTSRKVTPLAKKLITQPYNVTPSSLEGKIRTRIQQDAIAIDASRRRFPLIQFSGKWGGNKTPGATASIIRARTKQYAHSWIRTIKGLTSIRIRTDEAVTAKQRGPVRILRGPSPFEMIMGGETDDFGIKQDLTDQLIQFYVSELRRLMAVGI